MESKAEEMRELADSVRSELVNDQYESLIKEITLQARAGFYICKIRISDNRDEIVSRLEKDGFNFHHFNGTDLFDVRWGEMQ